MRYAREKGYDSIVVSIFVNPTQFGPTEDFDKYPRTEEADLEKLSACGHVDAVYLPRVSDMYPSSSSLDVGATVTVQGFSHQLEGSFRPTHFTGVATVVCKLFNMVQPHGAVFGQKDIQQCMVLKRMVLDLAFNLKIHIAPTKREPDALALSSRNRYLSPEERRNAVIFPEALLKASSKIEKGTLAGELKAWVLSPLEAAVKEGKITSIDYVSLSSASDLSELAEQEPVLQGDRGVILSATIRMGKTRLLDNILINMPGFL